MSRRLAVDHPLNGQGDDSGLVPALSDRAPGWNLRWTLVAAMPVCRPLPRRISKDRTRT